MGFFDIFKSFKKLYSAPKPPTAHVAEEHVILTLALNLIQQQLNRIQQTFALVFLKLS